MVRSLAKTHIVNVVRFECSENVVSILTVQLFLEFGL